MVWSLPLLCRCDKHFCLQTLGCTCAQVHIQLYTYDAVIPLMYVQCVHRLTFAHMNTRAPWAHTCPVALGLEDFRVGQEGEDEWGTGTGTRSGGSGFSELENLGFSIWAALSSFGVQGSWDLEGRGAERAAVCDSAPLAKIPSEQRLSPLPPSTAVPSQAALQHPSTSPWLCGSHLSSCEGRVHLSVSWFLSLDSLLLSGWRWRCHAVICYYPGCLPWEEASILQE